MKKILLILLAAFLALPLTGCKNYSRSSKADVVFIRDLNSAGNTVYVDQIDAVLENFCEEKKAAYSCYKINGVSESNVAGALDLAVKAGAGVVAGTADMEGPFASLHAQYPELTLVLIDAVPSDEVLASLNPPVVNEGEQAPVNNLYYVNFNMFELGYCAGYLIPFVPFKSFGILDGAANQFSAAFTRGLVYGLSDGAVAEEVHCAFTYYDVTEKDANSIQQTLYHQIYSREDTMIAYMAPVQKILENFSTKSSTFYIGMGSENDPGDSYFYAQLNYRELFRSFYTLYQRKELDRNVYTFSYSDGVFAILYPEDSSDHAELALKNLNSSIKSGSITLIDPMTDLNGLNLPNISILVNP